MPKKLVNEGLHKGKCKVCNSPNQLEIEKLFLAWEPLVDIAIAYPEVKDDNIRNHANYYNLFEKRLSDSVGMLKALLRKRLDVPSKIKMTALDINTTIMNIAKLQGKLIEKSETTHKGKIDVKAEVKLRIDNLKNAIGMPDDDEPD